MLVEDAFLGTVARDDTMYVFGPDILVAFFCEALATQRARQLPPEKWYDFYPGDFVGEGTRIERIAEQMHDRLPLFVREGAHIPMLARNITNTDEAYGKAIEIGHYGSIPGSCQIYEHDGKAFAFELGESRFHRLNVDESGNVSESSTSEGPVNFCEITAFIQILQEK